MDAVPTIDGYPVQPGALLADAHDALTWYLIRNEETGWKVAFKELSAIRDKSLKIRIWRALLDRLRWLREHDVNSPHFEKLRDVTNAIEKWTLSPTEAELCGLVRQTAGMLDIVVPHTPMPHLMAYVSEQGLTKELAAAIDEFSVKARGISYRVNQVQWQLLLSRLDMLEWRNEWNEVALKRCWSEQIRADFRAMHGAERDRWRRLLHSIDGDQNPRPAPRWMKESATIVSEMGVPAFTSRLSRWFEPLRAGATVRLSRPGSHILRALIWIAATLDDAGINGSIHAICDVKFTPKANGTKVIYAAIDAAGRAAPPPEPRRVPTLEDITERALKAVLSPAASMWGSSDIVQRIEIGAGVLCVRGDLDRYRLHLSSGEVHRESDGKPVDVDVSGQQVQPAGALLSVGIIKVVAQALLLAQDSKHRDKIRLMHK